jgi:hypothetical protein
LRFPPKYYTAWKNTGWWHLNRNQCATVYGPALANTWGYVYALISDGSSLTGANVPFKVANTRLGSTNTPTGHWGPAVAIALHRMVPGAAAARDQHIGK